MGTRILLSGDPGILTSSLTPNPSSTFTPALVFYPSFKQILRARRRTDLTVCFVLEKEELKGQLRTISDEASEEREKEIVREMRAAKLAQKLARKNSERLTYLVAAVMSSFGITSMAVLAVYYRFSWQIEGGEIPYSEMFGTFALSVGAAVGMEFWARWAHRALWHASLWHMHREIYEIVPVRKWRKDEDVSSKIVFIGQMLNEHVLRDSIARCTAES